MKKKSRNWCTARQQKSRSNQSLNIIDSISVQKKKVKRVNQVQQQKFETKTKYNDGQRRRLFPDFLHSNFLNFRCVDGDTARLSFPFQYLSLFFCCQLFYFCRSNRKRLAHHREKYDLVIGKHCTVKCFKTVYLNHALIRFIMLYSTALWQSFFLSRFPLEEKPVSIVLANFNVELKKFKAMLGGPELREFQSLHDLIPPLCSRTHEKQIIWDVETPLI